MGRGDRRELIQFRAQPCKLTAGMTNAALVPCAPIARPAALGQAADAGLKELVGLDAKEPSDPIDVFDLNFGAICLIVQKFVDPGFRVPDVPRQRHLALLSM